jgi:glycerol-3-phosphate acyltransferase PlsY
MDPLISFPALVALGIGYVLGSIPFGLILTRAAGLGDVRTIGSGNIGATNVLRTGNKKLAAATLVLDALKGTVAVLIGHYYGGLNGIAILAGLLAGLGAFVGHVYPVWLGFKGGKGVATYIGVLIGAAWPAAVVFCGVWLTLAVATRYSSLSALIASVVAPIYLFITGRIPEALLGALMTPILLWKHSPNIKRLLAGEEPRIGAKA